MNRFWHFWGDNLLLTALLLMAWLQMLDSWKAGDAPGWLSLLTIWMTIWCFWLAIRPEEKP